MMIMIIIILTYIRVSEREEYGAKKVFREKIAKNIAKTFPN